MLLCQTLRFMIFPASRADVLIYLLKKGLSSRPDANQDWGYLSIKHHDSSSPSVQTRTFVREFTDGMWGLNKVPYATENAKSKLTGLGQRKPLTTRFTRSDTNQSHEQLEMFRVVSWLKFFWLVSQSRKDWFGVPGRCALFSSACDQVNNSPDAVSKLYRWWVKKCLNQWTILLSARLM